jgi:hypothetical protein
MSSEISVVIHHQTLQLRCGMSEPSAQTDAYQLLLKLSIKATTFLRLVPAFGPNRCMAINALI